MDVSLVTDFLNYAAIAIDAVGVAILIYGALLSFIGIVRSEISRKMIFDAYENVKRGLIQKIILSLDFFVSADLIRLVLVSDIQGILSLALIVAIRTVLSWSLNKEIQNREVKK